MGRLTVRVEQDHLERLVKSPLAGLAELIWNSLDADASRVDVTVELNDLGGPESVMVTDDGSGITLERAEREFGHLGGSWKKLANATDGGRMLHGQAGKGRWAAYGLGETVRWNSVADRVTGSRESIEIIGRHSAMRVFEVSESEPADNPETGTTVEVAQLTDPAKKVLEKESTADELAAIFALYLQHYPVSIVWRGTELDARSIQSRVRTTPLIVEGVEGAELTVIEWSRTIKRELHFCDASGISIHQIPPRVHAPGFEFTAYIRWAGFRDHQSDLALAEMAEHPLAAIVESARDELRRYFKERAKHRGAELVLAWKNEKTYPYHDAPSDRIEQAKRDLFDIVAVAAAPAVETADVRSRRLSLRLLREAIERSPNSIYRVLREVLELSAERLEEFELLLEKTSLSCMISAASRIADRLDFLVGLEQIVFDRELRKHILERRQLHRILVAETWLFREEYALTADDVTLRTALKDHIKLLGRDDLSPAEVDAAEVLDEHGRRVVVDMMLSRVIEQRRNQREHIVIELKRPTVHVGMEQFSQIQNYATAVAADSRFASIDCRWEFWIVGDELDPSIARMARQSDREPGVLVFQDNGKFVVRAVTWAQVIQDARHRLGFVKTALDYSTSDDAGIDYLRRTHGKYLPPALYAVS